MSIKRILSLVVLLSTGFSCIVMPQARKKTSPTRERTPEEIAQQTKDLLKDLLKAAEQCDTVAIDFALKQGAPVNAIDETTGETALMKVVSNNQKNPVKNQKNALMSLLLAGADVEQRNSEGRTPLYIAVEKNNSAIVAMLLGRGNAKIGNQYKDLIKLARTHGLEQGDVEAVKIKDLLDNVHNEEELQLSVTQELLN